MAGLSCWFKLFSHGLQSIHGLTSNIGLHVAIALQLRSACTKF